MRDAEAMNDMLFDGVGYGHSHYFSLSGISSTHLVNYLCGKDSNVPIQGWMDRSDEIKPPSIKGYKALMSQMLIRWRAYKLGMHLEVRRLWLSLVMSNYERSRPRPLFLGCWAKSTWMGGVVLLPLKMEVQLVIFFPLD